jgi:YYY domain-containing protein
MALLAVLTRLLYLPYSQWYGAGYNAAELWRGSKTPIDAYLYVYGLFFFVFVTLLVRESRRWLAETPAETLQNRGEWLGPLLFALVAFAAFVGVLYWMGYQTAVIVVPLASWVALLLLRGRMAPERRAVLALIGLGLALSSVVEVVVLKGDIGRMNTVFKFYLQVWVLFSVAAGACLAWVVADFAAWRPGSRRVWLAGLVVLTGAAGLYTLMATGAKMDDRMAPRAPRTLDGMLYMSDAIYHDRDQELRLAEDYAAIRWMQANVTGSPVIVEANTPEYRWGSRFTIYTGLPGVIGWNWHQRQQRAALPSTVVTDRVAEVEEFYATAIPEQATEFIRQYDVEYVVVGDLEKAYYAPDSLAKFETLVARGELTIVYQSDGGTRIYEVVN